MKLYHCEGTWQLPGQQDRHAHKVFLPHTPETMRDWLNERAVPMDARPSLFEPEPKPFLAAPIPAAPRPTSTQAADIEDFILNTATVAEVERIFAALGTRFAEARR